MASPSVAVVSCSDSFSAEDLVKRIGIRLGEKVESGGFVLYMNSLDRDSQYSTGFPLIVEGIHTFKELYAFGERTAQRYEQTVVRWRCRKPATSYERKPENSKETHAEHGKRTHKLHTERHLWREFYNPEQVLAGEGLAEESVTSEDGVESFPWRIDNKYYSASVRLCPLRSKSLVSREFSDSVQAFLAYFDASQKGVLAQVSEWLSFSQHWAPSVLVLVCDHVDEQGVSRREAQEWCIQAGFELVELSPLDTPDEDDDFPETTGVKRIIQALSAHVWPNLQMKERTGGGMLSCALGALEGRRGGPGTHRPCDEDDDDEEEEEQKEEEGDAVENGVEEEAAQEAERVNPHANGESRGGPAVEALLETDIQELAALTTADSADCENFERLYVKLREMKDRAVTMPHDQRKVHAEKVAKAFWMAIGGDMDEIDGLSSGED